MSSIQTMGPCPSPLMVVSSEVTGNMPLSQSEHWELEKQVTEAGLILNGMFLTAVTGSAALTSIPISKLLSKKHSPGTTHWAGLYVPDALLAERDRVWQEISLARPEVVCGLDDLALFVLTGKVSCRKWRGSILQAQVGDHKFKVIPTLSPAAVFREWDMRGTVVIDWKRVRAEWAKGPIVRKKPTTRIVRPNISQAFRYLNKVEELLRRGKTEIEVDIETRAGHISCIGVCAHDDEAICIPLMCVERPDGYWTAAEEALVMEKLGRVLCHPNADNTYQNGNYDQQYMQFWYFWQPRLGFDTMISHHSMFSTSKKSLDYLASIYCDHYEFWKDDGKNWDPSMPEEDHWNYNIDDLFYTREIRKKQEEALAVHALGWPALPSVVRFQNELSDPVLRMMERGVRTDLKARHDLGIELRAYIARQQAELEHLISQPININSPKQMMDLFYSVLGQTPIKKRKQDGSWGPSTDDDSLSKIAYREPLLAPVVELVQALRSASKFDSTYLQMPLDRDQRLRCAYGIAKTITYRFNSTENAFGTGGNLQNIPEGDEDGATPGHLPNIRKLFIPDPGYTWFDLDGDSADLRIVTWESDCRQMKEYFAAGVKPYVEIAKEFYHDPSITKHHHSYKRMKALCHATNYLGEPMGLSSRIGLPVHEIERMQKWYFAMCPEIKAWQENIKREVDGQAWIENIFGYRCYFNGRITQKTYGEAVAWKPQSGVACWINRCLKAIDTDYQAGGLSQLLLQVHDSLDGQFPTAKKEEAVAALRRLTSFAIETPSGPMVIPIGLKFSEKSWGDCE